MKPKVKKSNDSKSLFRDVLRGAITAKLKKNELIMVMALLERTLGYGKAEDANTDSRLEDEIEGVIRRDHMKIALTGVIKAGIFDREKHPSWQWNYSIGKKFLKNFDGIFFTPTLPKIGNQPPKREKSSETWGHTALDLNSSLSLQIQQRSPVVNISTAAPRFPIFDKERCSRNSINKKPVQPEREWQPQWDWETAGLQIPASISQSNQRFCRNNLLKCETPEQARDALTVYNNLWEKGTVSNPAYLLKALAEKSRRGDLALPQKNERATIRIAAVPTPLDDSLTAYARKHGFSEPRREAGFGYLKYRNQLVKEREIKLKALNQKESNTALPAETSTLPAMPDDAVMDQAQTEQQNTVDRFNALLAQASPEKSIQEIAFETGQMQVLRTLNVSTAIGASAEQIAVPDTDNSLSEAEYKQQFAYLDDL